MKLALVKRAAEHLYDLASYKKDAVELQLMKMDKKTLKKISKIPKPNEFDKEENDENEDEDGKGKTKKGKKDDDGEASGETSSPFSRLYQDLVKSARANSKRPQGSSFVVAGHEKEIDEIPEDEKGWAVKLQRFQHFSKSHAVFNLVMQFELQQFC